LKGKPVLSVAIVNAESYDVDELRKSFSTAFEILGYDKDNPLRGFIHPGMRVFIKPNWVASRWRESCSHRDDIYSVITHPAVIQVMAEFVDKALMGEEKIIVGDNPSIDADFDELMHLTNIKQRLSNLKTAHEVLDLRPLVCKDLKDYGNREKMVAQPGDPYGYETINLKEKSLFYGINNRLFRGVFKQRGETREAHNKEMQYYTIANSIYDSDVYISLPKLKTHHKVGATLNLKGLVGTIGAKNQLVHWRVGFPAVGGDEYPDFKSWLSGTFSRIKSRGSWHGNDTIWRMVVDLYQVIKSKQRSYFSVIDGVLGGEGNGPFCPHGKRANTLIFGRDLVDVDLAAVRYMGFLPEKIPYLKHLMDCAAKQMPDVYLEDLPAGRFFASESKYLDFRAPDHWPDLKV
jgi:uncharacterized protein (DUF362 family)